MSIADPIPCDMKWLLREPPDEPMLDLWLSALGRPAILLASVNFHLVERMPELRNTVVDLVAAALGTTAVRKPDGGYSA